MALKAAGNPGMQALARTKDFNMLSRCRLSAGAGSHIHESQQGANMGGGTYVPPAPAPPLPGAPAPPPPSLYHSAAVEALSEAPTPLRSPEPSAHPFDDADHLQPAEQAQGGPQATAQPAAAAAAGAPSDAAAAEHKPSKSDDKYSMLGWFGLGRRKKSGASLSTTAEAPAAPPAPQPPSAAQPAVPGPAHSSTPSAPAAADSAGPGQLTIIKEGRVIDDDGASEGSGASSPRNRPWLRLPWTSQPVTSGARPLPAFSCGFDMLDPAPQTTSLRVLCLTHVCSEIDGGAVACGPVCHSPYVFDERVGDVEVPVSQVNEAHCNVLRPITMYIGACMVAEEIEEFAKKKARFQMLSRKNARGACKSMQSILTRRIFVNDARGEALQAMKGSYVSAGAESASAGAKERSLSVSAEAGSAVDRQRIPMLLIDFTNEQVLCCATKVVSIWWLALHFLIARRQGGVFVLAPGLLCSPACTFFNSCFVSAG